MAAMVKTYMMLCIAGLVVTVCVLMVMYRSEGSEATELVVKVAAPQNGLMPLRQIKGTKSDEKTIGTPDNWPPEGNKVNMAIADEDDDDDDDYSFQSSNSWLGSLDDGDPAPRKDEEGLSPLRVVGDAAPSIEKEKKIGEDERTSTSLRILDDDPVGGGVKDKTNGDQRYQTGDQRRPSDASLPLDGATRTRQNAVKPSNGATGYNSSSMRLTNGAVLLGHAVIQNDGAVVQNDGAVIQNGDGVIQNGGAVIPNGGAAIPNGGAGIPNGGAVIQNGGAVLHDDEAPKVPNMTGGTTTMVDMRISGIKNKFKAKFDSGVQDLIRHPEAHAAKAARIQQCGTPKNNIMMMKTHKCSSSTMQNILLRWGEDHNLTFALPRSGVYLGSPSVFDKQFVMESNGGHYNILCNHMRYNEKAVRELMPEDTVYIALLRDPATQYESMFTYYRFDNRFHTSLDQFIRKPQAYFINEPGVSRHAGRNPMLFDFGFDARHMEKGDPKVEAFIDRLSEIFDLVLIAEHFTESLILLKEKLCWSLDDVVFFNQNARSKSSVKSLLPSTKQGMMQWNWADNALYRRFNRTLWEKIDAYGRNRMAEEVAELERKNADLAKLCIGSTKQRGDKRLWYPAGVNINSFVLSNAAKGNRRCQQMTTPELVYLNLLRQKQVARDTVTQHTGTTQ